VHGAQSRASEAYLDSPRTSACSTRASSQGALASKLWSMREPSLCCPDSCPTIAERTLHSYEDSQNATYGTMRCACPCCCGSTLSIAPVEPEALSPSVEPASPGLRHASVQRDRRPPSAYRRHRTCGEGSTRRADRYRRTNTSSGEWLRCRARRAWSVLRRWWGRASG
jgi:hypothetical protein